jgi:hypothetical protein
MGIIEQQLAILSKVTTQPLTFHRTQAEAQDWDLVAMYLAKLRRMYSPSWVRPVAMARPSSEIIVSRPQSVNQWYPAIAVRTSSPMLRA